MAVYQPEFRSGKPYIIADEVRGVLPVSQGGTGTSTPSATVTSVVTTGSTLTAPYGYVTSAQADALVAAVNSCLACLKSHGLMA